MKSRIMILVYVLILSFNVVAQNKEMQDNPAKPGRDLCEKALKYYVHSLDHHNSGVVESAIMHIMSIKCYYPQINYTKVIYKLQQLVEDGDTGNIRAMAFICCNYLTLKGSSETFLKINERDVNQLLTLMTGDISEK